MADADVADAHADTARWRRGFWTVAVVFWLAMAFTTVPTPLYPLYEDQHGYGTATITVIFAVYPLGVMASVFLLGHVSDWIGRRRAIVPALALEAASAAAFALSPSLPVLLAARVVCGIAVGVVMATAAAYLSELDLRAHPGQAKRSDLVSTAATLGGFGSGALLSGVLAAGAPAPLRLPFVVFLVLLVLATLAATRLPETLETPLAVAKYRAQRVAVPRHARRPFFAACASGFAAFSLLSLFTALAPTFLVETLHSGSPALAGAVACSCCFAAGLGQIALARLDRANLLRTSLALLPAGIALVLLAVSLSSLPLFLLGGTVGGLGSGALFKRSLGTVEEVAPQGSRAETFAGFYLAVYLNGTVPVVSLGILTQGFGVLPAVAAYAAMVLVVLAGATPSLRRGATALG